MTNNIRTNNTDNKNKTPKFADTIRVKSVGRAERRAKVAKPVSSIRIVSSKDSPRDLLMMFARSYQTLTNKRGWVAPDVVEA